MTGYKSEMDALALAGHAGRGDLNALEAFLRQTYEQLDGLSPAEIAFLDGVTAGTATASKALVVDANKDIGTIRHLTISGNLVTGSTTLSEAELGVLDAVTAGTAAASKAVVLDSSANLSWSATSASTDGGTSVEPIAFTSTMTGAGGVGGRARFRLDTDVVLGGWANALKGITVFGSSGAITGLASAVLGEISLEAGCSAGTYAAIEAEMVMPSGALTGTASSFLYCGLSGAAATTFDANGFLFNVGGLTAGGSNLFASNAKAGIGMTHTLKVKVNSTVLYLACHTSADFGGS